MCPQPCIGFVMIVYDLVSKIFMGICFGFAVTAVRAMVVWRTDVSMVKST